MSMRKLLLTLTGATSALLLIACGGGNEPEALGTPAGAGRAVAESTVIVETTPAPARTPTPAVSPTAVAITGSVRTKFDAVCSLGQFGPEIRVRYGIEVTDGEAAITRALILVNDVVAEDSGRINDQIYVREVYFPGSKSRVFKVEFRAETHAAEQPAPDLAFVRCPAEPAHPSV